MGGGDKPLLTVAGRPMLASVIAALGVTPIAISANGDPARFAAFGAARPVRRRVSGPRSAGRTAGRAAMGGLAGHDRSADGARRHALPARRPRRTPAARAVLRGQQRPSPPSRRALAGLLRRVTAIRCCPDAGSRRVADFAERIGMRMLNLPCLDGDPFANVNTPDDLAQARARSPGKVTQTASGMRRRRKDGEHDQDRRDRGPRRHRACRWRGHSMPAWTDCGWSPWPAAIRSRGAPTWPASSRRRAWSKSPNWPTPISSWNAPRPRCSNALRCRRWRPDGSSSRPRPAPCCPACIWPSWPGRPARASSCRPARCWAWTPCVPPPRDRSKA